MSTKVKFTIHGQPQGKGRPQFSTYGGNVRAITPQKTVNYENLIKLEYERQCNGIKFDDDARLDVRIFAYYAIPKSVSKKQRAQMIQKSHRPSKKPDMDNVTKSVLDALNNLAYRDDSQVVDIMVRKFYSEYPRTVVTIEDAKSEDSTDYMIEE